MLREVVLTTPPGLRECGRVLLQFFGYKTSGARPSNCIELVYVLAFYLLFHPFNVTRSLIQIRLEAPVTALYWSHILLGLLQSLLFWELSLFLQGGNLEPDNETAVTILEAQGTARFPQLHDLTLQILTWSFLRQIRLKWFICESFFVLAD